MSMVDLVEQASPSAPAAGRVYLYAKADGRLYIKDDTGLEVTVGLNFPVGTRMLFQQTAAPTGWTKEASATYNDSALRIVTGAAATGGADNFTTLFGAAKATAGYALAIADIPSHTHTVDAVNVGNATAVGANNVKHAGAGVSGATGGGGAHSHTLNNMNLKYSDCIIAVKD